MSTDLTLHDIHLAQATIGHLVHETPLLSAHSLGQLADCQLFLKAENLQRAGSFKIRGATNKISHLSPALKAKGVVAASAGNHAQGVALAARGFGIPCTIVMPTAASIPKVEATRGYGATIVLHGRDYDEAEQHARQVMRERDLTFIHAFDDAEVMAGQGTIGLELLREMEDVDIVVVPVGGGGLAGGIALAMKETRPGVTIVGVQARASAAFVDSYRAGRLVTVTGTPTIADGIAIGRPGGLTFPLVARYIDDMVVVDEEDITLAMVLLLERSKLLGEGAGAVGVAAVLGGKVQVAGKKVVVVLSGGNVDPNLVARALEHGLAHAGRYLVIRLLLEDRPGHLSKLLGIVAGSQANVLDIDHLRHGPTVPLGYVEVQLTLETRDWTHAEEVRDRLRNAGYELDEEGAGLGHE